MKKWESLVFSRAHNEPMWVVYLNSIGLALTFAALLTGSIFILVLGIGICLFIGICYGVLTVKLVFK